MDVQMDEGHFPPGNKRGIIAEPGCRCQKRVDSGSTFKVRLDASDSEQNITQRGTVSPCLSTATASIDRRLNRYLLEVFS